VEFLQERHLDFEMISDSEESVILFMCDEMN
jgi:hypothetical protein